MDTRFYKEALFGGMTANAFKLGAVLTLGWFWVRVGGCRVVYRGGSMRTVNFDDVLAVAELDANEITLPGYVSHEAGQVYFYVVRCVNRCGRVERTLQASVRVAIDGDGGLCGDRPNGVFGLAAKQIGDSKVELVWTYSSIEQGSNPAELRVYFDDGTGEVDYQDPVTVVPYKGRRFYRIMSEQLEPERYVFAIRAADAVGVERESMRQVAVEVSGGNVEAVEIVDISSV